MRSFELVSNGLKSQRDEWVYDFEKSNLREKAGYLIAAYELMRKGGIEPSEGGIKWDRELERYREAGISISFSDAEIVRAAYRPFTAKWLYFDRHLNGMTYQLPSMFPIGKSNLVISFSDTAWRSAFCVFSADGPVDLHFGAAADAYQIVSRYRYADDGSRLDNITDWALGQFRDHYQSEDMDARHKIGHEGGRRHKREITKDAVFHYVYAVLHDTRYREKYAQNLKREFPRIPFYEDFWLWEDWGEKLMALHLGYKSVEPWPLERIDVADKRAREAGVPPKAILRADKSNGNIRLDTETQLTGVPPEAWNYRLGNRSALDWILDQYKEKTPRDPTIREKFNTYRFADYKEKVIDLLLRVTRVSVETVKITDAMRALGGRDRA